MKYSDSTCKDAEGEEDKERDERKEYSLHERLHAYACVSREMSFDVRSHLAERTVLLSIRRLNHSSIALTVFSHVRTTRESLSIASMKR